MVVIMTGNLSCVVAADIEVSQRVALTSGPCDFLFPQKPTTTNEIGWNK